MGVQTTQDKNRPVGRNEPCPCGSGNKYKRCCGLKPDSKSWLNPILGHPITWIVVVAAVVVLLYGLSQTQPGASALGTLPGVNYFTDVHLPEVNFSNLSAEAKKEILDQINRDSCTCGCGMTLAQCVATDKTCPLRDSNIVRIQDITNSRAGG